MVPEDQVRNLLCMAEINRMDHSIWAKAFPMDSSDPSEMQQEMGEAASRLAWLSEHGDGTNQTDLAARMAACFGQSRLWLEPEEMFNKTHRQEVCMNICRTIQDATPGFPASKKGKKVEEGEPEGEAAMLSSTDHRPERMEDGVLFLSAPSPSLSGLRRLATNPQQPPSRFALALSCPWQLRRTEAAARVGCLPMSFRCRLRGGMPAESGRNSASDVSKAGDVVEEGGGREPAAKARKVKAKKGSSGKEKRRSRTDETLLLSGKDSPLPAEAEGKKKGAGREKGRRDEGGAGGLLGGLLAEAEAMAEKQKRRELGEEEEEEEEEEELSGREGDWARVCKSMGWVRDEGREKGGGKKGDTQARMLGLQLLRICDKASENLDPMTELGKFEVDVDAAIACIDQGADVNLGGEFDLTALHMLCAADGHQLLISRLLQAGADVALRDVAGNTPLHEAVRYRGEGDVRCLETVKLLLDAGADPLAGDREGETARQMAEEALARHEWVQGMESNISKRAREIVKLVGGDEWHGWKEFNRRYRRMERKREELEKRQRRREGKVGVRRELTEVEDEVAAETKQAEEGASADVRMETVKDTQNELEQPVVEGSSFVESAERMEEDEEEIFGAGDGEPTGEGDEDW